jgi:hypothetical protein
MEGLNRTRMARADEREQSGGRNLGSGYGPIGSLQFGFQGGPGQEVDLEKEMTLFRAHRRGRLRQDISPKRRY